MEDVEIVPVTASPFLVLRVRRGAWVYSLKEQGRKRLTLLDLTYINTNNHVLESK